MAAITTFGTLKDAIREYAHRPTAIDSMLAVFVGNTTAKINRRLRCRQMESSTTLTSSTDTYTLPSDFLELRARSTTDGAYVGQSRVPSVLTPDQQGTLVSGDFELTYYLTGSSIVLGGNSDAVSDLDIIYYAKLATFVNDADTNSVLTDYPMVYLYGSMAEYALWAEEDDAVFAKWFGAFNNEMDEINRVSEMAQYGPGPLSIRVY